MPITISDKKDSNANSLLLRCEMYKYKCIWQPRQATVGDEVQQKWT